MAYTDHTQVVNDALHALLIGEHKIPVDYESSEDYEPDLRRGECIRYYNVDQVNVGNGSGGEHRQFNYELDHFFNRGNYTKKQFEKLIWERYERTRQLLKENRTYQPSNVYKWNNLEIEEMAVVDIVDENDELTGEKAIHIVFNFKRFCEWT